MCETVKKKLNKEHTDKTVNAHYFRVEEQVLSH